MPKQVFDIHSKRIVLIYDPSEIVFVTTPLGLQPQLADEGRYVDVSEPHTVEQDGVQRRAYALNDGTVAIQDHQGRFSITKEAPSPVEPVNDVQARDLPPDPNAPVDPNLSPAPAPPADNAHVAEGCERFQEPYVQPDPAPSNANYAVAGTVSEQPVANPTGAPSDQASLASAS